MRYDGRSFATQLQFRAGVYAVGVETWLVAACVSCVGRAPCVLLPFAGVWVGAHATQPVAAGA
jgi:hypothetical protein